MNFNGGYLAYWGAGLAERYTEAVGRWASEQAGVPYIPALTSWGAHLVSNAMLRQYRSLVNFINNGGKVSEKTITPDFFKGIADKLNLADTKRVVGGVFKDEPMLSNKYFIKVFKNGQSHNRDKLMMLNDNNFVSSNNSNILLTFLANSITMPGMKSSNTKFTRFDQDMYFPNNISYDGGLVVTYYGDIRNKFDLLIREIMAAGKFRNGLDSNRDIFDISVTTYTYKAYLGKYENSLTSDVLFATETVFKDISVDNVANYNLSTSTALLEKTISFNFNDVYDINYSDKLDGQDMQKLVYYTYKGFMEIVNNELQIDETTMQSE